MPFDGVLVPEALDDREILFVPIEWLQAFGKLIVRPRGFDVRVPGFLSDPPAEAKKDEAFWRRGGLCC